MANVDVYGSLTLVKYFYYSAFPAATSISPSNGE
jgi:hypothetical protein